MANENQTLNPMTTTMTVQSDATSSMNDATTTSEKELAIAKFDRTLIKNYPRSNRKVQINFGTYSLTNSDDSMEAAQSMLISPAGIEFQTAQGFTEGTLLRIHVNIPDYWQRKCRFVEYRRIDQPARFSILGKVVMTENVGKRGKKKIVTVQTVSIDETDEMVLKSYLQEG
jgi:hypothetical protein